MTIEDFLGNKFGSTLTQSKSMKRIDELQIDIKRDPISYVDSGNDVNGYAISPASGSVKEQCYEHAALQAWCLLMNAYMEDVPVQRKSQLLKEWQNAEQRLARKKMPRKLSYEGLN